jgi:hypothetical protein
MPAQLVVEPAGAALLAPDAKKVRPVRYHDARIAFDAVEVKAAASAPLPAARRAFKSG